MFKLKSILNIGSSICTKISSLDLTLFKTAKVILTFITISSLIVIFGSLYKAYFTFYQSPKTVLDVSNITLNTYNENKINQKQKVIDNSSSLNTHSLKEKSEQIDELNKFQEQYRKLLNQILVNLSEYCITTNQVNVTSDRIKNDINNSIIRYNSSLQIIFLKALVDETLKLLSSGLKDTNVPDFINWFIIEFDSNARETDALIEHEKYKIETEKKQVKLILAISLGAIISFIICTILLVLIKIEVNTRVDNKMIEVPDTALLSKTQTSPFYNKSNYSDELNKAIENLSKLSLLSNDNLNPNSIKTYLNREIEGYSQRDKIYFMISLNSESYTALNSKNNVNWRVFISTFLDNFHQSFNKIHTNNLDCKGDRND